MPRQSRALGKGRFSLSLLVVAVVLGITTRAANVQQLPGHFGGFSSDGGTWTVADDFQFEEASVIGGLNWWGGYLNTQTRYDQFSVRLFSDDGGGPGSLLEEFTVGPVSRVATGQFVNAPGGYEEFKYSAGLATPFRAEAGVTYWISIVNSPRDLWLWEASGSTANLGVQRSFDAEPWQSYFDNAAFEMLAVPEPDGMLFVAAGLASVTLLRRFRGRPIPKVRGASR